MYCYSKKCVTAFSLLLRHCIIPGSIAFSQDPGISIYPNRASLLTEAMYYSLQVQLKHQISVLQCRQSEQQINYCYTAKTIQSSY